MMSPLVFAALIVISTASLIEKELGTTSTINTSGVAACTVLIIHQMLNIVSADILAISMFFAIFMSGLLVKDKVYDLICYGIWWC